MANTKQTSSERPKMRMGGPMAGSMPPGEKARDFRGTLKKLIAYVGRYKVGTVLVMIFAILSTAFIITGPKILSKAITELANGLVA
ncbi:MAG: ABC transporter ATP-binding protein, partial [Lachnospiraceae bacterium]